MGPNNHNARDRDTIKRAIIAVRNKEMHLLEASVLYKVPKSTLEDKISEEQNTEILIIIRSCRKSVLSEADFRLFSERNYVSEIRNIAFIISHTMLIPLFLKKYK
jgi:hypothetical protein